MPARTRSQGLTASVAQDRDRDLLLAAVSKSDPIVVHLMETIGKPVSFRPKSSLDAWRNQLLKLLPPSGVVDAIPRPPPPSPVPDMSVSPSALSPSTVVDAVPSPPCPSPVPALSVSTSAAPHLAVVDVVRSPPPSASLPELSVGASFVHVECCTREGEGSLDPLTLRDAQCAGCSNLRIENERLQQAEQQASERVAMLEAENQHLRSLSQQCDMPVQTSSAGPAAEADTAAAEEIGAEAPSAEFSGSSVARTPLPSVQVAQTLQVVVYGLQVKGNASCASLLSSFSMFCRDQLHLRGALTMRAVRVFKTAPGTAAGVVALHTGRELEALLRAKRQHLRAGCGVSIEPNRTRAERLACTIARRAWRATPSQQRPGAAEGRIDVVGQQASCSQCSNATRSTLRADAPEFVPASASVSQHTTSTPSSVLPHVHTLHQE